MNMKRLAGWSRWGGASAAAAQAGADTLPANAKQPRAADCSQAAVLGSAARTALLRWGVSLSPEDNAVFGNVRRPPGRAEHGINWCGGETKTRAAAPRSAPPALLRDPQRMQHASGAEKMLVCVCARGGYRTRLRLDPAVKWAATTFGVELVSKTCPISSMRDFFVVCGLTATTLECCGSNVGNSTLSPQDGLGVIPLLSPHMLAEGGA